jgi:hypothetical protein
MTARRFAAALALLACSAFARHASARQPIDSIYSAQIRELPPNDLHWKFTTDLVSTLPASSIKVLGYVPGTLGRLSYVADLNRYFDAFAPN